ncbi:MAG TPA: hypothetical protein VLN45_06775 [Ignavibacteriaceae bacterium]|nr:hypothetical protein [Ignavibacteriaceae bacterium]
MHRINFNLVLIFLPILLISCSEEKNSLTGKWEPVIRPYNLGRVLIFEGDSSYTEIKEARINYTYKLAGDTLISTSFSGFTGQTVIDSAHISISGDTLILVRGKIGDQQETIMKRYDSSYTNEDGIIGFWKWPHESGKDAISEYHPDGKASVCVTIERREGNYFVKGDSLTIIMPGTSLKNIPFQLKGDSLFFPEKFSPLGKAFYRVKSEDK